QKGRPALRPRTAAISGCRRCAEGGGSTRAGATRERQYLALARPGAREEKCWYPASVRLRASNAEQRSRAIASRAGTARNGTDQSRLYGDSLPDRRARRTQFGDRWQHGWAEFWRIDYRGQPRPDVRALSGVDAPRDRVARRVCQIRRIRCGEGPASPPARQTL